MNLLFPFLIIMNALGALLMLVDKDRARKKLRRIDEGNLFLVAAIGGSFGVMLGMYMARHKTNHARFTIGVPVILVLQIVLIILWLTK